MTLDTLPDGYKVLVDSPDDGYIDSRGWVPVQFAATEKEAAALVYREEMADPREHTVIVTGKSWHRRDPDVLQREGDDYWYRADGGPCEACEGTGKAPEPASAHANGNCDECWGFGIEGCYLDYEPWAKCEPDAEGAVEMWDVELGDA